MPKATVFYDLNTLNFLGRSSLPVEMWQITVFVGERNSKKVIIHLAYQSLLVEVGKLAYLKTTWSKQKFISFFLRIKNPLS